MMSSSVVLPQPLGPTRQTNSPSATSSETSSSACTIAAAVLKHLLTPCTASFVADMMGLAISIRVYR
jgi:hypothetical protein